MREVAELAELCLDVERLVFLPTVNVAKDVGVAAGKTNGRIWRTCCGVRKVFQNIDLFAKAETVKANRRQSATLHRCGTDRTEAAMSTIATRTNPSQLHTAIALGMGRRSRIQATVCNEQDAVLSQAKAAGHNYGRQKVLTDVSHPQTALTS